MTKYLKSFTIGSQSLHFLLPTLLLENHLPAFSPLSSMELQQKLCKQEILSKSALIIFHMRNPYFAMVDWLV